MQGRVGCASSREMQVMGRSLSQAARTAALWRGMSSQSPPWGDGQHGREPGDERGSHREAPKRAETGRGFQGSRPRGAIDWLFASIHSSQAMRTVVGGRFGHKYWGGGWGDPVILSQLRAVQSQVWKVALL